MHLAHVVIAAVVVGSVASVAPLLIFVKLRRVYYICLRIVQCILFAIATTMYVVATVWHTGVADATGAFNLKLSPAGPA